MHQSGKSSICSSTDYSSTEQVKWCALRLNNLGCHWQYAPWCIRENPRETKSLSGFSPFLSFCLTHTHWFWFSSKKKKFDKYSKHVAMKCIRRLTFCVIVRMWYKNYLQGMCHDRGICQVPKLWTFGDAWFRMFAYSVYVRGCVCVTFA